MEAMRTLRSVRRLLVAACVVPSSPIFVTLMKKAPGSSETWVLTRATRRNNPEDTILNVGIGLPFHNQSLHHTSRFFFRGFLLHIRTKAAKASASSFQLDVFQVQTGACSSILVTCCGEGILCVLVQKDWSCKLVKLAVTCVAILRNCKAETNYTKEYT
jgi:hypothetical protein